MKRLFKKIPLSIKLLMIAIIPLFCMVYFAVLVQKENKQKLENLSYILKEIDKTVSVMHVIDELQLERRLSINRVLKPESENELLIQRTKTDIAISEFLLQSGSAVDLNTFAMFDKLQEARKKVDIRQFSSLELIEFYSSILRRLSSLIVTSPGSKDIAYIAPALESQRICAEQITDLGVIVAKVYQQMNNPENSEFSFEKLNNSVYSFKSFHRQLLKTAPPKYRKKYETVYYGDTIQFVIKLVDNMIQSKSVPKNINGDEFWNIATAGVDMIKAIQRDLLLEAENKTKEVYAKQQEENKETLVYLILLILFIITFVFFTIITIIDSLNKLKSEAIKIAEGKTNLDLQPEAQDIIGSLAQSILRIDDANTKVAIASQKIGKGDFSVALTPRSDSDVLITSINLMKEDLVKFNEHNKEKVWVQEGLNVINDKVRGEKPVATVSKDVLKGLAEYLNVPFGTIYLANQQELVFCSGFGISDSQIKHKRVAFGETLLGEVADSKNLKIVSDIPEDFIKVSSPLGESTVRHLIFVPLVHNEKLQGIIELGSFKPLEEKYLQLLNLAQEAIAISLQAAKSREKLQQLFEETQSQSEELQTQHSELENINAELEAQAQKLQASEEELRVQQEELLEANAELEERANILEEKNQIILERNLEIQKKAEELELSTKYKSEFLANMSHELRTPLNSIILLSRLLTEDIQNELKPEQKEFANVIHSSGQGLLSLIDEILDLSKIEAGKMNLDINPFDIASVISDMKGLFQPIAQDRGLELRLEVNSEAPEIMNSDKQRIEQILKNLLSNALKFTSSGYVSLQIENDKNKPGNILFKVSDTGIGIPEEKQQLIFEAFQQADGSTRRKYGGTGLGLSISRQLTKLLAGSIWVKSEGRGSIFYVSLPADYTKVKQEEQVEEAEAKKIVEAAIEPVSTPELTSDDRNSIKPDDKVILIVEDDIPFAKALMKFVKSMGYKVLHAVSGELAAALAEKYLPAGILLDVNLPGKNGWQVMEEIKSKAVTRNIPVHIMSSDNVQSESKEKGAIDFINKPFALEQLHDVLSKVTAASKEYKKVLILEENSRHAKALAYFLETTDLSVEVYADMEKGLESLASSHLNCVILDLGSENLDPFPVLEKLKQREEIKDVPVIIFTAKHLSTIEEQKLKQYVDSIVIKTASSYQRILDEVALFLHVMKEPRNGKRSRKMKALDQVLEGKKVLVVDDDVRNVFSLSNVLENHKMKVITAVDGQEALNQLKENPDTNLVLMDIMMPVMDGFEATKSIRSNPAFKHMPIIAITAKTMPGDREKCIVAGASDYISKPVDTDQLISLLRVWLYDTAI